LRRDLRLVERLRLRHFGAHDFLHYAAVQDVAVLFVHCVRLLRIEREELTTQRILTCLCKRSCAGTGRTERWSGFKLGCRLSFLSGRGGRCGRLRGSGFLLVRLLRLRLFLLNFDFFNLLLYRLLRLLWRFFGALVNDQNAC